MDKPVTYTDGRSVSEPGLVRREPVRISTIIVSVIQLCVLGGLFTISQQNALMLGAAVETLIYAAMPVFLLVSNLIKAEWQRRQVASPVTAETLANAVKAVENARGKGAPVKVPLAAVRAAERVLDEPEHPVRWIGDP